MKNRVDFERKGGIRANSVRALVAALCVLGLASLTLLHSNDDGRIAAGYAASTQPTTDGPVANSSFLHAPTGDPSVPSAESVFSRKDATPDDDPPATEILDSAPKLDRRKSHVAHAVFVR